MIWIILYMWIGNIIILTAIEEPNNWRTWWPVILWPFVPVTVILVVAYKMARGKFI